MPPEGMAVGGQPGAVDGLAVLGGALGFFVPAAIVVALVVGAVRPPRAD